MITTTLYGLLIAVIVLGLAIILDNTTIKNLLFPLLSPTPPTKYRMIVDAGSTGSRLFIYDVTPTHSPSVLKIGGIKSTPGLSCFLPSNSCNPDKYPTPAKQYMKLVRYANEVIPEGMRGETEMTILATAGMRLLTEEEQNTIYSTLRTGLLSEAEFTYNLTSITTLSGSFEGYYGLVSSNHLLRHFGEVETMTDEGYRPVGSLDMGGSSTQITFLPGARGPVLDLIEDGSEVFGKLFINSYLGYGADTFREGVWDDLVARSKEKRFWKKGGVVEVSCAFKGWRGEWKGVALKGTGDAKGCREEVIKRIKRISREKGGVEKEGGGIDIDGVRHPQIRGRFIAMSLYFFALDCLRVVGGDTLLNTSWPRPSMNEVLTAADKFCKMEWNVLEPQSADIHKWTRKNGLQHRCFEAVYIATVLKDAYGFEEDGRRVQFRFDIGGEEVEWTRGMVMVERGGVDKY